MEELKGRVIRITSTKRDGTCLFYLDTPKAHIPRQKNGFVLCNGQTSRVTSNMPVLLKGDWENGVFHAEEYHITWISNQATIDFLQRNCKGIGKKTAGLICSFYGKKLFSTEKEDLSESLKANFPRIPCDSIDEIIKALFQEKKGLFGLEKIFSTITVDYSNLLEIYDDYGDDSVEKFLKNPYHMGIKYNLPLQAVDLIAYNSGIDAFDHKRIEGIIQYNLKYAATNGHTYVDAKKLADGVSFVSESSRYGESIPKIYTSSIISMSKQIINDHGKIGLKKYIYYEQEIAKRLKRLSKLDSDILVTDDMIDEISKEVGITLGKDQKDSVKLLETGGVNILTGGPGVGKTTSINMIIRYFKHYYPKAIVEFCAPTGSAAKRLAESTNSSAKTIHKMLEFKPYDRENVTCKNQSNPIKADFIVVDEMSMVDAELMCMLLDAVQNGTRLLLVGDENQLPSIGAGNVFHDIIASGLFPVYRLKENFRQKDAGSLHENCERILHGKLPKKADDFLIYQAKDEQDAYNGLCYFMKKYYNPDQPFDMQLIEPSKKGIAGTVNMNLFVHSKIVHASLPDVGPQPTVGDKVIFTKTSYEDGYVNGDIGIIKSYTAEEIVVWNGLENLHVPAAAIHDISLAYSYTIHKSQGSENETIIIYLPESMAHMMTRSLFYTAVTRARKQICIVYTGSAIEKCLKNTTSAKRNTRLLEFLIA